ncbi:40-residue YVTN family beta-propeller repeat-containing protein [Blastococcus aurantiacus]|uniref:40-residue YVTN family beta-propeller repeat-containing protein n=1 Tax=Blastococcus aurantiacus TaxID=1550231 RepID=A0A1G7JK65_9ACTN|nr:PQQ-binding-like beta-propeller repeat protein [Blastococcus aurantiacus]SDF25311.1 40-residue YVTN family beta-propeller repeat-containing protein [Blastococcus aurantiacus]
MRRAIAPALTATALAVVLAATGATAPAAATDEAADGPRAVMFVGNNWEGTATVVDAATHEPITTISTIPDRRQRMAEIIARPDKLAFYLAIQAAIGEGRAQYTDDMYTTHDGRLLAVSRPSFADVVAIDLATGELRWRFPMEGYRSDHMGVSPDGTRLLVSDSTANKVHELDFATGRKTGEFPSGDSPHENNYTADGSRVFHASIGRVYTPTDRPVVRQAFDTLKGEQWFQIVRTDGLTVEQRWDMGRELEEAGYPGMASAVRPMAVAPDERYVYLQVSFFHGWIEFDTQAPDADTSSTYDGEPAVGAVTRVVDLPKRTTEPREKYVLDSAHHGLAINPAGTTLCAAGTMDGYAAIVDRETGEHRLVEVGEKPYWSTNGVVGDECWVSVSGTDEVVVIDYATAREIARIPVGDHPQRVRAGVVAGDVLTAWE